MQKPLITVLTPTYNRADMLIRLAASLKVQGCAKFEWLVVDDGSTDRTSVYLDSLGKDEYLNLRCVRFENGGKHRSINRAPLSSPRRVALYRRLRRCIAASGA